MSMPAWAHRRSSIWAMPLSVMAPWVQATVPASPHGDGANVAVCTCRGPARSWPRRRPGGAGAPCPPRRPRPPRSRRLSTLSPATSPRRQPLSMKAAQHGRVASVLERGASQAFSSFRRSSSETAGRGPRGLRVAHPHHRVGGYLALVCQPLEQLLEPALQRVGDERLDVVTGDAGDRRDAEAVTQEGLEQPGAVPVGADGLRALVGSAKRALPTGDEGSEGCRTRRPRPAWWP